MARGGAGRPVESATGAAPRQHHRARPSADAVRHFADALPDPRSSSTGADPCHRPSSRHAGAALPRRLSPAARSPSPCASSRCSAPSKPRAARRLADHRAAPDRPHRDLVQGHRRAARRRRSARGRGAGHRRCRARPRRSASSMLRTDFIANASHELRTPLTSLVGFIDTLLGLAANDKRSPRALPRADAQPGPPAWPS